MAETWEDMMMKRSTNSNTGYGNDILVDMNNQRKAEGSITCDVILMAGDRRFPAHKAVLVATSDYFRSMFTAGDHFIESHSREIQLQGVTADALEVILDMIYTSKPDLDTDNVYSILAAADLLLLSKIKNACVRFLQYDLEGEAYNLDLPPSTTFHTLRIWKTADLYNLTELKMLAELSVGRHLESLMMTDDFKQLRISEVKEILASDQLQDISEEFVIWQAASTWLEFDLEKREVHTDALMSVIRFPLISLKLLVNKIKKHHLMSSDKCQDYIHEALSYQAIDWERCVQQTTRTKPRCTGDFTLIYCLAGIGQFLVYIPDMNRWHCLEAPFTLSDGILEVDSQSTSQKTEAKAPKRKEYLMYGILTVKAKVFIKVYDEVLEDDYVLVKLRMYSITTNTWTDCKIPEHTDNSLLIECDGVLFNCSVSGIESYDPQKDLWTMELSDSLRKYEVGVSDDKQIYLYYGTSDDEGSGRDIVHIDKNFEVCRENSKVSRIHDIDKICKLGGHCMLITRWRESFITREILDVTREDAHAGLYNGSIHGEHGKPGIDFPEGIHEDDTWETVCDRPDKDLYVLGHSSNLTDFPMEDNSTDDDLWYNDGVLPFYKVDRTGRWTRLACLPESLITQGGNGDMDGQILQLVISDSTTSMATTRIPRL